MKVLVVATHPDDEVLGVGGTLLKHKKNNDEIYICIVTRPHEPEWSKAHIEQRRVEEGEIDKLLGIRQRFNLDYPIAKLNLVPHGELNNKISKIVEEVNPDMIYTHFEDDINYDHNIVFKACMVVTRPPKRIKLICFETLSGTEWSLRAFKPNYWVDIQDFIDQKIDLVRVYKTEIKDYPHPRSVEGVKILAKYRGLEICSSCAEAFIIIRNYD